MIMCSLQKKSDIFLSLGFKKYKKTAAFSSAIQYSSYKCIFAPQKIVSIKI
jgi:hypothetical protein